MACGSQFRRRAASPRRGYPAWGWLPLLVTMLIRIVWLETFPTNPIAPVDAEGFHLLAVNVLDGRGFSIAWEPPFCATAVRTPLYPLFLAGVYRVLGRTPRVAILVQVLLEVLTTAWVMALARVMLWSRPDRSVPRWSGATDEGANSGSDPGQWNRWATTSNRLTGFGPFLAGLLYAVNGTTQRYTGYLLSEALLLPLMAGAVYATARFLRLPRLRSAVWAAVTWGLALLTKPNVQFLVIAVGVLVAMKLAGLAASPASRTGHWVLFVVFWVTLGSLLLPWLVRNRIVLGRWVLSTAFEENLARVSAVATQAELQGLGVEPWTETWEYLYRQFAAGIGWNVASDVGLACDVLLLRQRQIAAAARVLVLDELGVYVRAHVRGVIRSIIDPGHRLWYRVITGRDWESTGVVPDIWARMAWSFERGAVGDALSVFWTDRLRDIPGLAGILWWGLVAGKMTVWVLSVRGAWRLRSGGLIALLLVGTVVYQLVLPGPIAHDRFYVPAVPVVSVLVARGAAGYNGFRRRPLNDTACRGGPYD